MTVEGERSAAARSPRRFVWIGLPILILAAAVVPMAALTGHPVGDFTRDVFSTAEVPIYTGIFSNAGVALWVATVAVCLFARAAVARVPARWRGFLVASALLTSALAVDDFFMLHEWVVPRLLGAPEWALLPLYVAATVAWLFAYRREIVAAGPAPLAAALALFAASTGMDFFEPEPAPGWHYLAEETLKLGGIGAWLGFFVGAAATAVAGGVSAAPR